MVVGVVFAVVVGTAVAVSVVVVVSLVVVVDVIIFVGVRVLVGPIVIVCVVVIVGVFTVDNDSRFDVVIAALRNVVSILVLPKKSGFVVSAVDSKTMRSSSWAHNYCIKMFSACIALKSANLWRGLYI